MNMRGQRVVLEPAARTASTNCGQQSAVGARSGRAYLNVTAASGTGGLTFQWRGIDKASGVAAAVMVYATAITATGMYVFELLEGSSGVAEGAVLKSDARPLPVVWDILIVHGDNSSYTYSLSVEYI